MRNGLLTTALLLAGVTFIVVPVATAQLTSDTLLPPGARLADEIDSDGITETLGEVTEAAMTVGGFNDLVERLVDADRNRIGDYTGRDLTTLNGRIRQLRRLWERRYTTAFVIDKAGVFGDQFAGLRIASGVINDPYQFARSWPLDATPRRPGGVRRDAELRAYGVLDDSWHNDGSAPDGGAYNYESDDMGGVDEGIYENPYLSQFGYGGYYGFGYYPGLFDGTYDTREALVEDADQHNIQRGREVAVVRLPARGNLPALNVSMIDEAYGWKIDIPETVEGATLRRLLLNHLTYLGENPQVWPRDEGEAARLFAHHVIMAVYGLGVPAYRDPQPAQRTAGTANASAPRTIEIVARDLDFHPNRVSVRPGEKVKIKLTNDGTRPHNIEFELPSGEVEFDTPVSPGQSKTLTLTAPREPGSYTLYCPVGQHHERGMEGKLVVAQQRS